MTSSDNDPIALPPGSWDVHVHVFDPDRYPYVRGTRYSPPPCSVANLLEACPTNNFVVTMSGPEGTDVTLTLDAMAQLQSLGRKARGVVVQDLKQMTVDRLRELDAAGVRSIRFNTRREGMALEDTYTRTAKAIFDAGVRWSVEAAMFDYRQWHALIPHFRSLHRKYGTIFVADHVFAAQPEDLDTFEFEELLDLVNDGIMLVKISGLNRYGRRPQDMKDMIKAVIQQNGGGGGVYGSDWPHVDSRPGSTGLLKVDMREDLRVIRDICEQLGPGYWDKILRDNAQYLYA